MTDYSALYTKLLEQKCSPEEAAVLMDYFKTEQGDAEMLQLIEAAMDREIIPVLTATDEQHILQNEHTLMRAIRPKQTYLATRWWFGAAAAVMVVLSVWFYMVPPSDKAVTYANDISAGKNGATLTLANGERILINDALSGGIASQAGVKITKTAEGHLIYEHVNQKTEGMASNTLTTSMAEEIQIHLMDGTLVFLNSGSSLQFPASFSGASHRVVSLKGEAYFEVARDTRHPFIVQTQQQKITVLGTHFNVNAYANENNTRTTLVEGVVEVALNNQKVSAAMAVAVKLSPGKEALSTVSDISVQDADLEKALSWKEGYFRFNDDKIEDIMKKISRWYDIDVVYSGKVTNEGFTGTISKKSNISQVLAMLEGTKMVHFKIEGRRVTVLN